MDPSRFYTAGGALKPDNPSYVDRAADQALLDKVLAGEFCFVLTSRQMGKSSLMARTARRLREAGGSAAICDLTEIGADAGSVEAGAWYRTLARAIARQ